MTNQLFEKAKQAVAEKRGAESWIVMYAAYTGLASHIGEDAAFEMLDSAYREVSERLANEAVKAEDFDAKLTPDYDGQFLGFFVQKQECGTIWKYWRIVHCEFNAWKLEQNERMICWRQLPPEPKGKLKLLDPLPFPQQPDER